jgi:PAS domain S-box-containing protein
MSADEEMYRRIVKAVPEGIWAVNPQGQTIFCNERMAEILGTDIESLQRLSCFDSVFPPDLEEAQRQFGLQIAGGCQPFDFRLRRMDGSALWVSISCRPMYDNGGVCIGLLGLFTDISQRRRAEKDLQDSEQLFRAIFSQAAVGITQFGVTGEWLLLNDRFCEIVGYTRPELQGKTVFDITHPDDREICVAEINRILAGEIPSYSAQNRYCRKDGAVIWVRLGVTPVWDADKRLQYFIGVVEDITEKMGAERARQDSDQRLTLAQSAARLGLWDHDLRTGVTVTSGEYARLRGLQPEDGRLTHEEWLGLIYPHDRERVQAALQESIERTHVWDMEFRVVWPDGSVRWLYGKGQVFLDHAGHPVRLAGVSLDITERKRVEEALRQSELLNKLVLDNIPVCIFLLDVTPDGRFKFVGLNPAEEKAVGFSTSEVKGRFVEDVLPADAASKVTARYRRCLEAGTLVGYEEELQLPVGSRHFYTNLIPIRDADGCIQRIVGCCSDLTDARRAQEEGMARQKLESLGVLAGGIAHDFNNLLGSIMAEAELVEADLAAGLSPDDAIAGIKTVVIHGAQIVRELLIYAGQNQASIFEPVDLSRLTAEILELLKVSISKHARLKINLEKNLPTVLGNAAQIRQVLMNLIMNASEGIGDKEGVIQVTTARATGGNDSSLHDAVNVHGGEYVRLEVSDNGSGMTEEAKAKIFDPFFTTKFPGRGLGLAVAQGIVRAHGGDIDVVSAPGQGATFQVLLPTTTEKALETQNAVAFSGVERSHTLPQTGATVLVVEDEEVLRRAISKALRIKGFSVIEAKDGSVAMDLVRTRGDDIDVILLDVTLPGASSREVFEEAKRIRARPKIVFTSAYDRRTVDALFPGLRITQFIRKPFRLDDLAGTLRNALAGLGGSP